MRHILCSHSPKQERKCAAYDPQVHPIHPKGDLTWNLICVSYEVSSYPRPYLTGVSSQGADVYVLYHPFMCYRNPSISDSSLAYIRVTLSTQPLRPNSGTVQNPSVGYSELAVSSEADTNYKKCIIQNKEGGKERGGI